LNDPGRGEFRDLLVLHGFSFASVSAPH
jgi:hypothetical protein